ncbi:DNA polymerase V protein UmuD [Pseudomonas marincola]|uniref:DNA polymerase V, subunit D n=1 Tax=Pseudomonas marincola TaxID=437900 RepID=A0A653E8G9_9PSED|nr:translesion error-prone DNA polymerase V autoproteolytic subunit [Pseudomonas marincola]CAE6918910.1 DNA polymerase V protein UmuD [Pseudomonas marincola]
MTIEFLGHLAFEGVLYPYFAFRVPAGFPSPAQDHLEQEISLDELFNLRAPHTYLVKVAGDSMVQAGIDDGDLLIVDRSREARHGAIVVAALNNEPLIKRFCREGASVVLRSENTKFAPRYIMENDELSVWGVVRFSVRCHDIS